MLSSPISHQKYRFPQCCGTLIPWEGLSPNSGHYHHEGPLSHFPHHSQYPIKLEVLYFSFLFFWLCWVFFFFFDIYLLFLFGCAGFSLLPRGLSLVVASRDCRVRESVKARFGERTRRALYRNRSPLMR